ncbi:hypothetical protein RN001_002023 [Aquatica leii]|uniref:Uncharacterized protein n=1 Tax=Aquatica leii TaxID=1421715 RepID=A0AAN7SJW4_9COLE|nr:hypothetical protein RN001_002023 [Aquatica leii]
MIMKVCSADFTKEDYIMPYVINNEYRLKFCTGIVNMKLFTLNQKMCVKNFCIRRRVSLSGMITYLSKEYGALASDKAIFNNENVINMLIPGVDGIIVDKGFLIDKECSANFIRLIRSPFLGNKQSVYERSC